MKSLNLDLNLISPFDSNYELLTLRKHCILIASSKRNKIIQNCFVLVWQCVDDDVGRKVIFTETSLGCTPASGADCQDFATANAGGKEPQEAAASLPGISLQGFPFSKSSLAQISLFPFVEDSQGGHPVPFGSRFH